jgi:type VI secretion system secreted protein Hcp
MKRILKTFIVAAGFGLLPAAAQADTFLLISGIAGDSSDPAHKNWIRVSSLSWGAFMPATNSSDGGFGAAFSAKSAPVVLTIPTGTWSREFLNNLTRGIYLPQVIIDHVNPDGRPAYRATFNNFLVTKYLNAPAAKAQAQDEVEGAFGSYKIEFFTVGADGRITSTSSGWNFVANTP